VQTTGLAPTQTPAWQVSVWVQAFPSVQGVPFGAPTHVVLGIPASQSSKLAPVRNVSNPGFPDVKLVVFGTLLTITPLILA
jgi:hypothetical protein